MYRPYIVWIKGRRLSTELTFYAPSIKEAKRLYAAELRMKVSECDAVRHNIQPVEEAA